MGIEVHSLLASPMHANAEHSPVTQVTEHSPVTQVTAEGGSFSNYLQDDDHKTNEPSVLSSIKKYAQGFLKEAHSVEGSIKAASMGQEGVDAVVPKVAVFAANVELVKGTTEAIAGAAKTLVNMQI